MGNLLFSKSLFRLKNALSITNKYEKLVELPIRNQSIFHQAFTHTSEQDQNYERLEFLGDAVLDSVVSDWLYNEYPTSAEGKMTILRSKYVSRNTLSRLANRYNFQELIISDNLSFKKVDETNVRILGDVFEAVIGAVFLTHGYKGANYFIRNKILSNKKLVEEIIHQEKNFKGLLLEKSQQQNFDVAFEFEPYDGKYYLVALSVNGKKISYGRGTSKKKAEQNASKYVIEHPDLLENFV